MSSALIIQQQQLRRRQTKPAPPTGEPWSYWDSATIADICAAPRQNVEQHWPLIHAALVERGIDDRLVQMAALGTVAIETASTFAPVREAFWMSEEWRRANLRYYPYFGRGHLQLTWDYNYRTYGDMLRVDLVSVPDRALEPEISARVLALYFKERGVADAALAQDWGEVRRRVQGAHAGLDRLIAIVTELERAALPVDEPAHVTYGRAILQAVEGEAGKRYAGPVIWEPDSFRWGDPGWDCSSLCSAAVRRASDHRVILTAYTDAMFNETLELDPADSVPGDLIFYYGYEDGQQAHFKHVGILAGPLTMFDAQFGKGVGTHPLLDRSYVLRRVPMA